MVRKVDPAGGIGRRLIQRPGIASSGLLIQASALLFRQLRADMSGIVAVRAGRKTVRHGKVSVVADAGDVVLLASGQDFDVINEPAVDGPYEAHAISLDPALLDDPVRPGLKAVPGVAVLRQPGEGLARALSEAAAAIGSPDIIPDPIATHRVRELLVWVAGFGFCFAPHRAATLTDRVRSVIGSDPAAAWRAAMIADRLAMSEPTLRRHLAAEGTSVTQLLTDVRMSLALALLQTTDEPVTMVALSAGYDSASRFAVRFRARFGFSPGEIRGRKGGFDRIGTMFDPSGAAFRAAE